MIISACLLSGCTWRTLQADYLLGPVRYRFSEPSTEKAAVFQSVHFPVLIEGGSQWGVSIGGIHRLALSSARFDSVDPADDVHATPRGWLIHPQPRRWQWSWIYLRAPLRGRPEFIRRSMVGVQGGAGGEERAISLGYSSVTMMRPRLDALYHFDFDSRRPLDAVLVANPVERTEETQEQPFTKRKIPRIAPKELLPWLGG